MSWTGAVSTSWADPGNWSPAVVPTANDTVVIGSAANQPVLAAAGVSIRRLVMTGASAKLDLNNFTLTLAGDLQNPEGSILNGEVVMTGSAVGVQGRISGLKVTGSATLQASTHTTRAVSVTGSLTIKDQALSIRVP